MQLVFMEPEYAVKLALASGDRTLGVKWVFVFMRMNMTLYKK
jgi:hypothetical protein